MSGELGMSCLTRNCSLLICVVVVSAVRAQPVAGGHSGGKHDSQRQGGRVPLQTPRHPRGQGKYTGVQFKVYDQWVELPE